jgi:hypothetical protein
MRWLRFVDTAGTAFFTWSLLFEIYRGKAKNVALENPINTF